MYRESAIKGRRYECCKPRAVAMEKLQHRQHQKLQQQSILAVSIFLKLQPSSNSQAQSECSLLALLVT